MIDGFGPMYRVEFAARKVEYDAFEVTTGLN